MPKAPSLFNYSIKLSLEVSRDGVPVKSFWCRREVPASHRFIEFHNQSYLAILEVLRSFATWWFPTAPNNGGDPNDQS